MNILLTNDDGIASPSLHALADRLQTDHDVWIVAPDSERSACSHSVNMRGPLRIRETGHRAYACAGSTADCVLISLRGFVDEYIDMVISGINLGPNLGTDIIYSGTAAGARQGALMGRPSIAASAYTRAQGLFPGLECQVEFIARNVALFAELWKPGHFININFPADIGNGNAIAITFPSRRTYEDRIATTTESDGSVSVLLEGDEPGAVFEEGSDYDAVKKSAVSISPIAVHPVNEDGCDRYRTARFALWERRCTQ